MSNTIERITNAKDRLTALGFGPAWDAVEDNITETGMVLVALTDGTRNTVYMSYTDDKLTDSYWYSYGRNLRSLAAIERRITHMETVAA